MSNQWLYIKNASPADGLALATVLSCSKEDWNVIHSSIHSCFIRNLQNVTIGHPDEGSEIITLEMNASSFNERCNCIASQLDIPTRQDWTATIFFKELDNELEVRLRSYINVILLYCVPTPGEHINLMMIDQALRYLAQDKYMTVDANSSMLPNIKGTKDYRGLIDVETIVRNKSIISTVITTEPWMTEICSAYGIKCCTISGTGNAIILDGITIDHPLQLANYIQNVIK